MSVEFRVLGDLEVRIDAGPVDIGHARQRCVLLALLVDANRVVSADLLVCRGDGMAFVVGKHTIHARRPHPHHLIRIAHGASRGISAVRQIRC